MNMIARGQSKNELDCNPPPLLSIVVPVYNERRTLRSLLQKVLHTPMGVPYEILVVDDRSTDGSDEIIRAMALQDARIKPIFQSRNGGKGSCLHTALRHAAGEIFIVQDADLEYNPEEIPRIIKPILDGKADAVFGSRFAGSECRRVLYYWHSIANMFLTWLTNIVCDLNLTDMETCYKAVRLEILKQIPLRCKRFGFEPEVTIRLAQWGARIYEVPISYSGRTYEEGKKITWKDGLRALIAIFWTAFLNRRFTTHDGFYVLTAVRGDGLNKWMYSQFVRFVGQNVLEAGCGIGNLSRFMLSKNSLTCVDIDKLYVDAIDQKFGHLENFSAIRADLSSSEFKSKLDVAKSTDTIICLNVLEHIRNDDEVIRNFYDIVEEGGHVIVLVPQYESLFGPVDTTVGHVRRYSRPDLERKFRDAGFDIIHSQPFNRLGAIGWWLNGKVFRKSTLSPLSMWLFNLSLPAAKLIEKLSFLPALSVIVVGMKPKQIATTTSNNHIHQTVHRAEFQAAQRS